MAWLPRPAALAQVERVELQPPSREEVREFGLEEVVGEPVDVQDRALPLLQRFFPEPWVPADEDRLDSALAVRIAPEVEDDLGVAGAQDVGLPVQFSHAQFLRLLRHPRKPANPMPWPSLVTLARFRKGK